MDKVRRKPPLLQKPIRNLAQVKEVLPVYTTEPAICSTFACNRVLTLQEQLAGEKCTGCVGVGKVDVMKIIKFK